jgi:LAO/AO transport system kinase
MELWERALKKDFRAIGQILRLIDDEDPRGFLMLDMLARNGGHAEIVGVTGSPGVGKSTLIDTWLRLLREQGKTVAVICVDPSSPFSGGAVLGDRLRMQRHSTDQGVFIRSVATRGQLGGLSSSVASMIEVLDAASFDRIIVETVGVGQDEVAIAKVAQCVVVVLAPLQGDEVQAHKAGVLEIADIIVVNKADAQGAEKTFKEVTGAIELADSRKKKPKVLKTVATEGTGIDKLEEEAKGFLAEIKKNRLDIEKERLQGLVIDFASKRFGEIALTLLESDPEVREAFDKAVKREVSFLEVSKLILRKASKSEGMAGGHEER